MHDATRTALHLALTLSHRGAAFSLSLPSTGPTDLPGHVVRAQVLLELHAAAKTALPGWGCTLQIEPDHGSFVARFWPLNDKVEPEVRRVLARFIGSHLEVVTSELALQRVAASVRSAGDCPSFVQ